VNHAADVTASGDPGKQLDGIALAERNLNPKRLSDLQHMVMEKRQTVQRDIARRNLESDDFRQSLVENRHADVHRPKRLANGAAVLVDHRVLTGPVQFI
jgi:hypothetical protein